MINQYEVPALLEDELPEIKEELQSILPSLNVIKSIQCFATYTNRKVLQHNLRLVKKCFTIADDFLSKGDITVKDAIENVFVYSISSLFSVCSRDEKRQIQGLMPLSLYTVYVNRILKSGI